jgi:hypothetical protein
VKASFAIWHRIPHGEWEPSTLTLDSESSRYETIKAEVYSTRGVNRLLFRGEAVRLIVNVPDHRALAGVVLQRGHYAGILDCGDHQYVFSTLVQPELVATERKLRRAKIKPPTTRLQNDEIWQCVSCNLRVMSRGSENPGWKGVQLTPEDPKYDYYCAKPSCVIQRDAAIEIARINWGYPPASEEVGQGIASDDDEMKERARKVFAV